MADDPLEEFRDDETEGIEATSEDTPLQPAESTGAEPQRVSAVGNRRSASRTIKVGN